MAKKKTIFQKNRDEIKYNLINAGLAGGLVFLGGFADGEITSTGVCVAIVTAGIVGVTKFRDYWNSQKDEYKVTLMSFY